MKFKLNKDLLIFDVETSGKDTNICSMIQLGAIKFSRFGYVRYLQESFSIFIYPYTNIWEEEAESIHHILKSVLLKKGVTVRDAIVRFENWCGNPKQYFLAAWSNGFDINVLKMAYKHINREYPFFGKSYDIASFVRLSLAKDGKLGSKHQSLDKCAKKIGIDTSTYKLHDAKVDALLTGYVLERIVNGSI